MVENPWISLNYADLIETVLIQANNNSTNRKALKSESTILIYLGEWLSIHWILYDT